MITKLIKIDENNVSREDLKEAGEIIRNGGLVALPTETVYGLGGNALDEKAAAKIYAAKGRPSDNPLIAHIADMAGLEEIAREIPEAAVKLADAFWPGPLTMIFPKKPIVPDGTTGGLDTVAVRMPAHPVAQALIEEAGVPIAAPSANISGRPSPTCAAHCVQDLDGRVEMIIDGGDSDIGLESTIVDMTGEYPMILRPGYITREMLEEVVGRVDVDPTLAENTTVSGHPKAPGMKYRHYAPKADMTMVKGPAHAVVREICSLAENALAEGKRVGIICTEESQETYRALAGAEKTADAGNNAAGRLDIKVIGSRRDPSSVAHNLFRILRDFDDDTVDVIFTETFASDHLGMAIMNRLTKAAGHKQVEV